MEITKLKNGLQWTSEDSLNASVTASNALFKATRDVDPETVPYIRLYSGTKCYVTMPRLQDIHIEDIAHHLSLLCRFTGAVNEFYSVAEHSVRVSYHVPQPFELDGLLHDGSEYTYNDMSRPFKRSPGLEGYRLYEKRMTRLIQTRFGLGNEPECVELADKRMLATERRDLYRTYDPEAYNAGEMALAYPDKIEPWSAKEAERRFLMRFYELTGRRVYADWFQSIPSQEENFEQWLGDGNES